MSHSNISVHLVFRSLNEYTDTIYTSGKRGIVVKLLANARARLQPLPPNRIQLSSTFTLQEASVAITFYYAPTSREKSPV